MEFRLLGPVELVADGTTAVDIGAPKRRAVLAALALAPNQVLDADRLIGRVWGQDPPTHARTALQGHVSALRKVITGDAELVSRNSGYELVTDPDAVDVGQFDRLAGEARFAGDVRVVELLHRALDLWRGPALTGTSGGRFLEATATRLTDSRLAVVVELAERLIRLGRPVEAAGLADGYAVLYPLREDLASLAVRALHAGGRRAGAFEAYHRTAQALDLDLGLEPSDELRHEYENLVAGRAPAPGNGVRPAAPVVSRLVPAQLPVQHAGFVGRTVELEQLVALAGADHPRGVITISGPAGIGKTALALRFAHQVSGVFPDGQLYADLGGGQGGGGPGGGRSGAVEAVLAEFLHTLGGGPVDPSGRPWAAPDAARRAAFYRSMMAGRRALVVLDDVRDIEQVRLLLPGAGDCLTIVTARERMEGLVAREGASHLGLTVLDPEDAVAVLAGVLGADRVAAEPGAARELARLCHYLPLDLRTAAARLAVRPSWTIATVVRELSAGEDPVGRSG